MQSTTHLTVYDVYPSGGPSFACNQSDQCRIGLPHVIVPKSGITIADWKHGRNQGFSGARSQVLRFKTSDSIWFWPYQFERNGSRKHLKP
eukprot:476981-Pleurochrysis_carterae.AAC.1